jgi:hypothetical protein
MGNEFEGDDFLDSLLLRFHITLKDLAECNNAHRGEIKGMERIFKLENTEDARRLLTVPRLLEPPAADDIIAYLREEEKGNAAMETAEDDIEAYKKPLAAAFVFNLAFFAAARNLCAIVKRKLEKQKRRLFEIVVFGERRFRSDQKPVIEYRAASGAEPVWREYGNYPVPDLGHIKIFCLDTGSFRYLKFVFSPKAPVPAELLRPYRIEMEFNTHDDAVHTLSALDELGGSGDRESGAGENIDYTLGLILNRIRIGPPEEST